MIIPFLRRAGLCLLVSCGAVMPLQACSSGAAVSRDADAGGDAGDDEGGDDDRGASPDGAAGGGGGAGGQGGSDAGGAGGGGRDGGNDAAGVAGDGGPPEVSAPDGGAADTPVSDGKADTGPTSITKVVTVKGAANLIGAGHSVLPPDPAGPGHEGMFPLLVELPAGTGRTLTVTNVSGEINIDSHGTFPSTPADGFVYTATPAEGPSIGGLTVPTSDRHAPLSGVFLGDDEPAEPGPVSYVVDAKAPTYNGITIAQIFFIGDGLAGDLPYAGEPQSWRVPDGATRLFLGFLDVDYEDNTGAIMATVHVSR